ncbi:hypothetical protein V7O62_01225 [Methanolobus sp. ZRKC2]|uniref:hypothetical protein n=1 Tax=Methanolobus sp. ZRKC2 TaxID=3125783 RepID=UPI003252EA83
MNRKMYEEETIEAYASTDSNIVNKVTFFLGIPLIIVFGWLNNKYMSIFSVEHNEHRLVIVYHGICPVVKSDRLRITGVMTYGGKLGIYGMVMQAITIENIDTGDIYEKV